MIDDLVTKNIHHWKLNISDTIFIKNVYFIISVKYIFIIKN